MPPKSNTVRPQDVADPEAELETQRLQEQTRREQEVNDLKWLMAHKQGRRIMWRLLEFAGVYRTSFTGNSETFFREGQRNVGLKFLAEVQENSPDEYLKMLKKE